MSYQIVDLEHWDRKEFYEHFINEVVCTFSATVSLDITNLKGCRLYPAMLWLLTKAVNQMVQFRTAHTDEGVVIYDDMHPAYTIFNREHQNFSGIWTAFDEDYETFLRAYESDTETYASSVHFALKPNRPANTFDVSMIPWFTFTSFNLNIFGDGRYLLPIFTMGIWVEQNGRRMLPLAIQVHHAVCDGYHVGQFVECLQTMIDRFGGNKEMFSTRKDNPRK